MRKRVFLRAAGLLLSVPLFVGCTDYRRTATVQVLALSADAVPVCGLIFGLSSSKSDDSVKFKTNEFGVAECRLDQQWANTPEPPPVFLHGTMRERCVRVKNAPAFFVVISKDNESPLPHEVPREVFEVMLHLIRRNVPFRAIPPPAAPNDGE